MTTRRATRAHPRPPRRAPENPPHGMSHDSVGLLETSTPPALSLVPNVATSHAHEPSRRRTQTALPDGHIVNQVYDASGRPSRTKLPGAEGVIERTYDEASVTGHIQSVSGPDLVSVHMTRAGRLPLTMTWSGAVTGQVAWSYAPLGLSAEATPGSLVAYFPVRVLADPRPPRRKSRRGDTEPRHAIRQPAFPIWSTAFSIPPASPRRRRRERRPLQRRSACV
jgi:hypothetical protein